MYLRMLLIQVAKSAVMTAHTRNDPISKWAHQLRECEAGDGRRSGIALAQQEVVPITRSLQDVNPKMQ